MFTENDRVRLAVGLKETRKVVLSGAEKVYLAKDAPERIAEEIKNIAGDKLVFVPTMMELGKMCGIDVKASCAAVRKI
ncbi:MAG: ribosomal L7Ae/L30e/S12e/Gadd45 family protein [Eubacteriales bacterium]|nr:ribosomal L7Ae/L30e/S12e/Gadd45 family protein [Eubacteriales bacterium]